MTLGQRYGEQLLMCLKEELTFLFFVQYTTITINKKYIYYHSQILLTTNFKYITITILSNICRKYAIRLHFHLVLHFISKKIQNLQFETFFRYSADHKKSNFESEFSASESGYFRINFAAEISVWNIYSFVQAKNCFFFCVFLRFFLPFS